MAKKEEKSDDNKVVQSPKKVSSGGNALIYIILGLLVLLCLFGGGKDKSKNPEGSPSRSFLPEFRPFDQPITIPSTYIVVGKQKVSIPTPPGYMAYVSGPKGMYFNVWVHPNPGDNSEPFHYVELGGRSTYAMVKPDFDPHHIEVQLVSGASDKTYEFRVHYDRYQLPVVPLKVEQNGYRR